MAKDTRLAIVVPCYNEQQFINQKSEKLVEILTELQNKEKVSESSFIYFVENGSSDETWFEIAKSVARHPNKIKAIKYSKNFNFDKAQLGGIIEAKNIGYDAVLTVDFNLLNDKDKIEEFINKFDNGYKIIFGVNQNSNEQLDYYLISSEVSKTIEQYKNINLSLKQILNNIGYRKTNVALNFSKIERIKQNTILDKIIAISKIALFSSIVISFFILFKFISNEIFSFAFLKIALALFIFGIQTLFIGLVGRYLDNKINRLQTCPQYIVEEELL